MTVLIGGLSLEQYAGVTAALAESFDLSEILEQEAIEASVWTEASQAWIEAIVQAPDMQVELIQKRRVAEDCLGRTISPLDTDPAAWTGLLGALAVTESPETVTAALGITVGDIARLGRHWKRKMEADPLLGKQIAEIAATAKPPTRIDAAPRKLQPFPWTPAARAGKARQVEKQLELAAAIVAQVDDIQRGAPRIELASFQLEEQKAPEQMHVSTPQAIDRPVAPSPAVHFVGMPALPPGVFAQMTAWAPADAPTQPATPFEALELGAHGISLLKYAQLITLLQEPGANASAILAGWGLDEEKHRAIEEHYNKKFTREARWATEFARLIVQAQKTMKERRSTPSKPPPGSPKTSEVVLTPPAPTPSAPPPRSSAPELSMEQYAWVTATIRKTPPGKLKEVLARLRLTPETHAELDARWQARMVAERGLSEKLGAMVKKQLFAEPPAHPPELAAPAKAPPSVLPATPPAPVIKIAEPRPPNRLQGTSIASESPLAPATPFMIKTKQPK